MLDQTYLLTSLQKKKYLLTCLILLLEKAYEFDFYCFGCKKSMDNVIWWEIHTTKYVVDPTIKWISTLLIIFKLICVFISSIEQMERPINKYNPSFFLSKIEKIQRVMFNLSSFNTRKNILKNIDSNFFVHILWWKVHITLHK